MKNENTTEGMIEILTQLQLTSARARQWVQIRVNSSASSAALRGLVPYAADWHAKVNLMSVSAS